MKTHHKKNMFPKLCVVINVTWLITVITFQHLQISTHYTVYLEIT